MTEPVKESATILDATAGNRTIWKTKEDSRILWIDVETDLSFKPDMILDCTNTGFPNQMFNLIIFDPPHLVGRKKNETMFSTPNRETFNERWKGYSGSGFPRYYGADKYPDAHNLKIFITKAEKEFYRVLNDNGILFLKWNDATIPLEDILYIFQKWKVMIKIPVKKDQGEDTLTYWIMLMKNKGESIISETNNALKFTKEGSLREFW